MRGRALVILLALSLGLNTFVAAGLVTLLMLGNPGAHALRTAADALRPPQRQALLRTLRADGRAARPQNQAARALRREVWTDLQAPMFDAAADKAKLARARALNLEARQTVEDGLLDFAATLPADERAALGRALLRVTPAPRRPGRPR